MAKKAARKKTIDTITHSDDKRKNIPTAEHQAVLQKEQQKPRELRYPRNTDLDPQLVWRGKDEKDWSDLVVQAPPLVVYAGGAFFSSKHQYLMSYKGLAFFCKSDSEIPLPGDVELIHAKKIWIPNM